MVNKTLLKATTLIGVIYFLTQLISLTILGPQGSKLSNLEREQKEINSQISQLENDLKTYNSMPYIEDIAQNQFGLSKPLEIIVIDNKKSKIISLSD